MTSTPAYAAQQRKSLLEPFSIRRRNVGPTDVRIEIDYCGVCYTDLHFVNNDWGMSEYPWYGHEIVGRIAEVGSRVTKFKEGELGAIGCMVNSCGKCSSCEDGLEQYCHRGFTATYNSPTEDPGGITTAVTPRHRGGSKFCPANPRESFVGRNRPVVVLPESPLILR